MLKKFAGLTPEEKRLATEMEINLWRSNEVRTYMSTTVSMLTLDNCNIVIPMKLWHISVSADRYFNTKIVEQHLRIIFDDVEDIRTTLDNHAPTVIASKQATETLIPKRMRQVLARKPA